MPENPNCPCPPGTLAGCSHPECDAGPARPDAQSAPLEELPGHILDGDADA